MSFNLNDSPTHFIVLNAIYKNFNTSDKIIKFTKLTKSEVETILKELESQRLVDKFEKKIFFFGTWSPIAVKLYFSRAFLNRLINSLYLFKYILT